MRRAARCGAVPGRHCPSSCVRAVIAGGIYVAPACRTIHRPGPLPGVPVIGRRRIGAFAWDVFFLARRRALAAYRVIAYQAFPH